MRLNRFLTALCLMLMVYILLAPATAVSAVSGGIDVWAKNVFPVLFPFFILSSIIKQTGVMERIVYRFSKNYFLVFTTVISLMCGYPTSSKLIGQSKSEINPIPVYALATSPSPMFIAGTIAGILLQTPILAVYILCSVYLSLFTSYMLLKRFYKNEKAPAFLPPKESTLPLGTLLHNAITDGLKSQGIILGIICAVSVLTAFLEQSGIIGLLTFMLAPFAKVFNFPACALSPFIRGILEMTTGITALCTSDISSYHKLMLSSFLVSFGGMAVILESVSFINGKIKTAQIIGIKLLHAFFTCLYLKLIVSIFPITLKTGIYISSKAYINPLYLLLFSSLGALIIHGVLRRIARPKR
ncbi:MAG: hypothetical protein IJR47_04975 [Clostridia bacterium]|nr:hypothetical protein [Clostridia bacterium]